MYFIHFRFSSFCYLPQAKEEKSIAAVVNVDEEEEESGELIYDIDDRVSAHLL